MVAEATVLVFKWESVITNHMKPLKNDYNHCRYRAMYSKAVTYLTLSVFHRLNAIVSVRPCTAVLDRKELAKVVTC